MPIVFNKPVLDVGADRATDETSDERFDRSAFARRAVGLVDPPRTTVAICEGTTRVHVESGRMWGRQNARWALLAIPPHASKRAIALVVAHLAGRSRAYALDLLMDEASSPEIESSVPRPPGTVPSA